MGSEEDSWVTVMTTKIPTKECRFRMDKVIMRLFVNLNFINSKVAGASPKVALFLSISPSTAWYFFPHIFVRIINKHCLIRGQD